MSTVNSTPLTWDKIDLDDLAKSTTETLHLLARYCQAQDSSVAVYIAQQAKRYIEALDLSILACRQIVKAFPGIIEPSQGTTWKDVEIEFEKVLQVVQDLIEFATAHKEYIKDGDSARLPPLEATMIILKAFEDDVFRYSTWWTVRDINHLTDFLVYIKKICVIQTTYPRIFVHHPQSPSPDQAKDVVAETSIAANEQPVVHVSEPVPFVGIENELLVYAGDSIETLACDTSPVFSMETESRIGESASTLELPPELMAQIFAATCHAAFEPFRARNECATQKTTPFTLGQVCRLWRAIIWSTPFIWSYVALELSCRPETCQAQIDRLGDWLELSGACPLTIRLFLPTYSGMNENVVKNLIKLLAMNAHRCQAVDFAFPSSWYTILNEVDYDFSILTTARCEDLVLYSAGEHEKFKVFKSAPLLNDIHLLASDIFILDTRWEQLVRVTLQHVILNECFYVLAKTPNLIYCCVEEIVRERTTDTNVEVLLLEELVVSNSSWPCTEQLLWHISMPSIQSLTISPQTLSEFLSLSTILQRAGYFLQRLKLDNIDVAFRESEILLCLRNLPSLVDIEISFSPGTHEPIRHFLTDVLMCQGHTVSASHTAIPESEANHTFFLPNMQHFSFFGPVGVGIVWLDEILADRLQTRVNGTPWTDDSSLQDLLLGSSAREKMKILVDDGLTLKLNVDGRSLL
ncbi:hypothetical protein B0H34DRAFT_728195 [Crassisporium funariophilum]|nr:hypothetical protein B0H34DRAFT_728195 [Crassisporium funariophilum]